MNNLNKSAVLPTDLIFTYVFQAPADQVFQAWTKPDHFKNWFRPDGFSVVLCEMDLKPGGLFRIHMKAPDGAIYPTKGKYLEIRPPEFLSYIDTWDDDRDDNPESTVQIHFADKNGQTELSLFSIFQSQEHRDQVLAQGVRDGWLMFMKNLKTYLSVSG